MRNELWLAYAAYLGWLGAGLGDFICHWRTQLRITSGVAESAMHQLQLALLAIAIVLGMAFEAGKASVTLILLLVIAHAIVGYVDTRIAFARRRVILPVEQHIHSVLDMAPVIGLAWLVVSTWPAATTGGWALQPRQPALPTGMWLAVLLPAALLCAGPALIEFRAAWSSRRAGKPPSGHGGVRDRVRRASRSRHDRGASLPAHRIAGDMRGQAEDS